MIDITGMDKAEILKALYDNSRVQGNGILHFNPLPMPIDEARNIVESEAFKDDLIFDYIRGRPIKCCLKGDTLDPWGYDRDLGQGACERALTQLTNKEMANG